MKNKFIFNIYSVNREGFLKIFIINNHKKKKNIEFQIKILMKRKCDILHSVISKFVHQLKFVFINLLHFIPCYID